MFTLLVSFGLRMIRIASDVLYLKYLRFNLYSICSFQGTFAEVLLPSGDGEIRNLDPLLARQVLSQLSYTPTVLMHFLKPFG